MKRYCNLDARGRRGRILIGSLLLAPGIVCLIAWLATRHVGFLYAGIGLSSGGLFMIVEGIIGWCALRALGLKTKY
ncbi:MAG: hypothetical protein NZ483_08040 [Verrucomicrobiae bacterium]|nr:hypothetical protein [Verrucomicrobiae bacterium]MDW8344175.1 hypothetical protein [Verrucomicrobiae bacterium]